METVSLAPGWVPGSAHEYGAALEQRRARGRFENLFEKGAALFGGPTPPISKHSYTRRLDDASASQEVSAKVNVLDAPNTANALQMRYGFATDCQGSPKLNL